jgi:DNA-binding NtrC family response regulator
MPVALLTGHAGPLTSEESSSIQQIADALAGAGLRTVRLDELEEAAIQNALEAANGNRTRAAKSLGIAVRTLQRKLRTQSYDRGANFGIVPECNAEGDASDACRKFD